MREIIEKEINYQKITKADMVVGIPSYNEADTIAFVVRQVAKGLKQYFPKYKSVIINCDTNSTNGTREIFLNMPTEGIPKICLTPPMNTIGKGSVLRMLFHKAVEMKAKAIISVDSDLVSITPRWIEYLGRPLSDGFDFVTPLYVRHKYDGTITNNLVYPLIRAIFGRRIRQPIGGEFGFSARLAKIYAQDKYWDELVSNFGIDVFMTVLALRAGAHICQSFMGRPKIHRFKDPAQTLGPMFYQIIGTIFRLMVLFSDIWEGIKWSKPTAIFGFGLGETELPPPARVDQNMLYQKFLLGFTQYSQIWHKILSKVNFSKLKEIKTSPANNFEFPTELWAKIVYDFCVAYKDQPTQRKAILNVLIPLYFGKTFSYVKKTERMSIQEAEDFIEYECEVFERAKPYLIEKWTKH